jgi:hypothetical protein
LRGRNGWALGQIEVHSDGQARCLATHLHGGAKSGSVRKDGGAGYDAAGMTLYDSAVDALGEAKIVRIDDELFQGAPKKLAHQGGFSALEEEHRAVHSHEHAQEDHEYAKCLPKRVGAEFLSEPDADAGGQQRGGKVSEAARANVIKLSARARGPGALDSVRRAGKQETANPCKVKA